VRPRRLYGDLSIAFVDLAAEMFQLLSNTALLHVQADSGPRRDLSWPAGFAQDRQERDIDPS
jgi:hypothetical protein